MTKEEKCKEQLLGLGVWDEAFMPEIHTLCIMERELSRAMKEWKATVRKDEAPSTLNPLYDVISKLRRDILTHREGLGLTPKGLRKLRAVGIVPDQCADGTGAQGATSALLDAIRNQSLDNAGGVHD